jgi:GMP synthase (glutamine-hydrolysing)
MHATILILDFGAQYTQLIARRVRELDVYCEIHPFDVPGELIRELKPAGIILSGGPESVTEGDTPRAPDAVWAAGVPVLGICYGMQAMAAQLGGAVESGRVREFGYAEVRARGHGRLLEGIQDRATPEGHGLLDVWMSHGDKVTALPPGFELMAGNEATAIAGMMDESRRFYAVQFHPEVTHTKQGRAILTRFVREICGCSGDWTMPGYVDEAVARIRSEVGAEEVILGLSGGVDSSVAAALIQRAIGDQLTCIFVDTGLLRQDEAAQVMDTFARHLGVKVDLVDAGGSFLRALAGVSDPEEKRKIIGREFVHVPGRAAKLPNAKWLARDHLSRRDRIGGGKDQETHTIVAPQHGGLPETLLEAARTVARVVQGRSARWGFARVPPSSVQHPFPGRGWGHHRRAARARRFAAYADAIFIDERRAPAVRSGRAVRGVPAAPGRRMGDGRRAARCCAPCRPPTS